ncbi:hypothetical protein V6B33_11265 [Mangrovibacillus sp. Mu-81]|uniref:hypothetical protein n=1 Tax=Mangrovibacillus sp. Mu-81 TaxID=3121478 RepID=UPI002FE4901D
MEQYLSDELHCKIVDLQTEVKDTYRKLNMMLSALDKRISELYHSLERTPPDDVDAIAFTSQLKAVLERRRVVKDERARLKLFNGLAGHSLREIELNYDRALQASFEIRQDFHVELTLEEVAAEMGVKI